MSQLQDYSGRIFRWLTFVGCFGIASVAGWFSFRSVHLYLFDRFPPVGRNWPVGWAELVLCLSVVAAGILLIKRRHYYFGFVISGFGSGCAAISGFGIFLLKVLPSC